jgi:hypothetical protein
LSEIVTPIMRVFNINKEQWKQQDCNYDPLFPDTFIFHSKY